MSLRANLFQVVAFAADPLHGNSAFALTGVGEATERQLTTVCAMLRTDIIAVVGDGTDDAHPLDSSPQLVPTRGQAMRRLTTSRTWKRGASPQETWDAPFGDCRDFRRSRCHSGFAA